jgi:hypothetical protein
MINVFLLGVDEYQNDLLIGATITAMYLNGVLYEEAYTFNDTTGTIEFTTGLIAGTLRIIYAGS